MEIEELKVDETEEQIEEPEEAEEPKPDELKLARVEYDYEAKEPDELSLDIGDIVTVLEQGEQGWWKGDLNGKVGSFPANHVKLIENKGKSDEGGVEENTEGKGKLSKKLINYGVKPGGVGSLFAGGFPLKNARRNQNISEPGDSPKTEEKREILTHVLRKTSRSLSEDSAEKSTDNKFETPHSPKSVRGQESALRAAPPFPRLPPKKRPPKPKPEPKAIVLYEYDATEDDEISLREGETIVILEKIEDDGWWKGRNEEGSVGIFPSTYVKEIAMEEKTQTVEDIESKVENKYEPAGHEEDHVHEDSHSESSGLHSKHHHAGNLPPIPTGLQSSTHEDSPSTPPPPPPNRRSLDLSTKRQSRHEVDLPAVPTHEDSPSTPSNRRSLDLSTKRQSQHELDLPSSRGSLSDHDNNEETYTNRSLGSPELPNNDQPRSLPERRKSKSGSLPAAPSASEESTEESQDTPISTAPPVSLVKRPIPPPRSTHTSYEGKTDAAKLTQPHLAKPPSVPRLGSTLAKPPSVPKRSSTSSKNGSSVSEEAVREIATESEKEDKPRELDLEERGENIDETVDSKESESTIIDEHFEKEEADVVDETSKGVEHESINEELAVADKTSETGSVLPPLPTGPRLMNLGAERPALKGRRPPAKRTVNQSQTEILEQSVAMEKDEVEESKQKPISIPPKPVKPSMFKLPISGGGLPQVTLRSVPKKPVELSASSTTTTTTTTSSVTTNTTEVEPISKPSVKSITSRFNIPNQSTDVEIRLRKWFNEEISKVKGHFEAQLAEERRKREELEELVREIGSRLE